MFNRIYIEITNICNLNCDFCPSLNRERKSMTKDEFEKVILKIKDYFYTFSILIIFILCGLTNSSVIGFVMYVATTLIMILLLMPETLKYCTNEICKIIKNHSNIRIK